MPAEPAQLRRYLAALYQSPGPLRPIEVYERGTGTTVPGPQRGARGASTARELKELIGTGEVHAIYRDDTTERATRYGLTAAGRVAGRAETRKGMRDR